MPIDSYRFSDVAKIAHSEGRRNYLDWAEEVGLEDLEEIQTPTRIVTQQDTITNKIWQENAGKKRINGHDPEYVAHFMETPIDELFPPNGLTLYIGDPWQKLDREGVVIIDYEYGEVAEFQESLDQFIWGLQDQYARFDWRLKHPNEEGVDPSIEEFILSETPTINDLLARSETANIESMPQLATEFNNLRMRIEAEIARQTDGKSDDPMYAIDNDVRSMWYFAVQGARARDVYDWEHLLKPHYLEFQKSLPLRLTKEQKDIALQNERRALIESIRLKKHTEKAHVVEGMFPHLPFASECFDSLVAYYSISTYVFPHLTKAELYDYWREIFRVLKQDGHAYIQPIFNGVSYELEASLAEFAGQFPAFKYSFPDEREGYAPERLHIHKTGD